MFERKTFSVQLTASVLHDRLHMRTDVLPYWCLYGR